MENDGTITCPLSHPLHYHHQCVPLASLYSERYSKISLTLFLSVSTYLFLRTFLIQLATCWTEPMPGLFLALFNTGLQMLNLYRIALHYNESNKTPLVSLVCTFFFLTLSRFGSRSFASVK